MLSDLALTAALADPARNLFGQHGDRCPHCSGWGGRLHLPASWATVTRATARCTCRGSGLDIEALQRREIHALVDRLAAAERAQVQQARDLSDLQRRLGISPHSRSPINSRQTWQELIAWATADGTAIANTTTEAIIFPNVTIPAGYMADGRRLRITAYGKLSTTGTPTMTWAIRWGGVAGTLLATSEALTMGSGVTNVNWELTCIIQTRTNGATGTLQAMGSLVVHTSSTVVLHNILGVSGYDAPAAVTVDLTADTALSVTGDWSAASASNTLTGVDFALESLN